jgi:hypothetical protein
MKLIQAGAIAFDFHFTCKNDSVVEGEDLVARILDHQLMLLIRALRDS